MPFYDMMHHFIVIFAFVVSVCHYVVRLLQDWSETSKNGLDLVDTVLVLLFWSVLALVKRSFAVVDI